MPVPKSENTNYHDQDHQVSWHGVGFPDGDDFNAFLAEDVAARLYDDKGAREFEAYLQGLVTTGFAMDSLQEFLDAQIPEEREWAVGEALAEAYLSQRDGVIWPWNMERDKRTPKASLPGADLVGFAHSNGNTRLVVGEVKTSSDMNSPPQVMYGRSGMTHQLDNLAADLSLINQLLRWLLFRCKNTEYEQYFKASVTLFLNSGNDNICLYGVLVRDTVPNENDLKSRARILARSLHFPATCKLIAIYLPCVMGQLSARVVGRQP